MPIPICRVPQDSEELQMALALCPIALVDVPQAGRICHDAFKAIAEQHNFPPDFPDPDVAIDLLSKLRAHPGFYGVIAEEDGRIIGSSFVDERSPIVGLGPITVDPAAQNRRAGAASAGLAAASAARTAGAISKPATRSMTVPATPGVAGQQWELAMKLLRRTETSGSPERSGPPLRVEAQFKRTEVPGCGVSEC